MVWPSRVSGSPFFFERLLSFSDGKRVFMIRGTTAFVYIEVGRQSQAPFGNVNKN